MSSKTWGYARVSTAEQNTARQEQAFEGLADTVVIDRCSGKNTDRPELRRLLSAVRAGDTVLVKSIDRLARNTRDLLDLLDQFMQQDVTVKFLDTGMVFDGSPHSRFIATMFGAVGELERSFIRQRQAEGVAIAKAEGKFKGKAKDEALRAEVQKLLAKGLNADEVAKLAGCGRATVFRIKKELAA